MTLPHHPSPYVYPLLMPLTPEEVLEVIYKHTGITKESIFGKSRVLEVRQARQMFTSYCIVNLKMPSTHVAKMLSGDHTSCLHNVKVVANEVEMKTDFGLLYKKIFNL